MAALVIDYDSLTKVANSASSLAKKQSPMPMI